MSAALPVSLYDWSSRSHYAAVRPRYPGLSSDAESTYSPQARLAIIYIGPEWGLRIIWSCLQLLPTSTVWGNSFLLVFFPFGLITFFRLLLVTVRRSDVTDNTHYTTLSCVAQQVIKSSLSIFPLPFCSLLHSYALHIPAFRKRRSGPLAFVRELGIIKYVVGPA